MNLDRDESPEVVVDTLLKTGSLTLRHVCCRGDCRGHGPEECAEVTELVFPYRGVFARSLGRDQAVAEANQVVFFNAGEGYRVSHPANGGDACLSLAINEDLLRELTPKPALRRGPAVAFDRHRQRIGGRTQVLATLLRLRLRRTAIEPLEAESLALDLARTALGGEAAAGASLGRQRMADRAKMVMANDLSRRWTLAEIAAEVGGSPVYLTQVFKQAEGVPLYRYQLRLRLAAALDRLSEAEDLTALGLDLGFSSHSHFTAAFRDAYGQTPSELRRALNA